MFRLHWVRKALSLLRSPLKVSGSETLKVPDDVVVIGALGVGESIIEEVDMLLTDRAAKP